MLKSFHFRGLLGAITKKQANSDTVSSPPRTICAAVVLFVGLSAANAIGGWVEIGFIILGFCNLLITPHQVPAGLVVGVMMCSTYSLLRSLIGGGGQSGFSAFLILVRPLFEGYFVAISVFYFCRIRTNQSLLKGLSGYVYLMFLSAVVMIVNPELRLNLLTKWYANNESYRENFVEALRFRGYGVSRHHLFGLPLAMGSIGAILLANLAYKYGHNRRLSSSLSSLACLLLVLPNARIGIVPLIVLGTLCFTFFFRLAHLFSFAAFIMLGFAVVGLLINFTAINQEDLLLRWWQEGVLQFFIASNDEDANTINDLSKMVFFPTDILGWLVGDGRLPEVGDIMYSDLGWVRLIQRGGLLLLVGVIVVYWAVVNWIKSLFNEPVLEGVNSKGQRLSLLVSFVIFCTFLIALNKGDIYAANDYSRLIMTLAVFGCQLNVSTKQL